MSEHHARSHIDPKAGGGWGAPPKADFGPADRRWPGLLFDGLHARGSAQPSGPAPRLERISTGSAAAPITQLRPGPVPSSVPGPAGAFVRRRSTSRAAAPQVRTVTHLDLRSVAKVSAFFYAIVVVVMVVASVMLWLVADAAGAVHSIDHSVQSLLGAKSYSLHPGTVVIYSCVAGVLVAFFGTVANLLAATVYNLIAEVVGGIKVRVTDT